MLVVRPARSTDYDRFIALAKEAGPGFTSLAVSEEILGKRLEKSVASFTGDSAATPDHLYLLMLEDSESGDVVGISGIKAQIGIRDPFFNFRILNVAQKSAVTNSRYDMEVLVLVNEYAGASEVGTLFVHPSHRERGAGRLISQARYMLMAAAPDRFASQVISELRGQVDDTGFSPFWEAIGRKFFLMDFVDADNFSAERDNQFILDLMPKYPIYAALLPQDAQAVMGKTHQSGEGARRYLEAEGFRYNGVIDIFDGGPSVSVPFKDIKTIQDSRLLEWVVNDTSDMMSRVEAATFTVLISNDRVTDFRCVLTTGQFVENQLVIAKDIVRALKLTPDQKIRAWIKR